MEVLNLSLEPAIFMPLSAFSDPVLLGSERTYGVNLNMGTNPFFKNLFIAEPDEETLSIGMSLAADRPPGDIGIVLVTRNSHLTVIAERWQDEQGRKYRLPIIWNAHLERTPEDILGNAEYYHVYCDHEAAVVGNGYMVYDADSEVFWNDLEAEGFRGGWH